MLPPVGEFIGTNLLVLLVPGKGLPGWPYAWVLQLGPTFGGLLAAAHAVLG